MRPPKYRQNRFLQPLNDIFGTAANVRLLRALALANSSLTAGELAKRAALSRTSIYPALRQLERAGVIEFIGAGAQRLVQLRDRYPLSRIIKELFRAEARRFDALTVAIRELVSGLPQQPISAWVDETGENGADDTLKLYVVARPEDLEKLTDDLNARLADTERKYDVHVAIHGLTRSELEKFSNTPSATLNSVVLVAGVPPVALVQRSRSTGGTSPLISHGEHDARSRRLALAIATKIKRDPGLIAIAEDRVKRRVRKAGPGERRELMEWIRVLSTMSSARLQSFLLEDTERAIRLRQTLPALSLLSSAEREAVVLSRTDADVIAAITHR